MAYNLADIDAAERNTFQTRGRVLPDWIEGRAVSRGMDAESNPVF